MSDRVEVEHEDYLLDDIWSTEATSLNDLLEKFLAKHPTVSEDDAEVLIASSSEDTNFSLDKINEIMALADGPICFMDLYAAGVWASLEEFVEDQQELLGDAYQDNQEEDSADWSDLSFTDQIAFAKQFFSWYPSLYVILSDGIVVEFS